jgi:hypothetical protein
MPGALVTAIADAAYGTFALLAGPLSQHQDPAVALAGPGAPAPEAGQSRPPGTGRGRPGPGPLVPARAAGGRYAEASSTEKALVRARSASAARMVRPTGNASSGCSADWCCWASARL